MRLNIRSKQIAGVTAIVALVVVALSALFVARLADVVVGESRARAEYIAKTILHRVGDVPLDPADPYASLRADPGLQSVLQASLYGEGITGAAILDAGGVVVMHSDPSLIGRSLPLQDDLVALDEAPPLRQLRVIYSGDGRTLEASQQMLLGNERFGSIRVGASTLLMRRPLTETLSRALVMAAIALLIAIFVSGLLSRLLLRPIHVLRSGLTRLGRGEVGVTLDLPPGDEFGELGTFFNTISQQLSADRLHLAGQKANLQSAVENLEDAVALFNPAGDLLFANPAMQRTIPADAIGRALQALLPGDHPYRTLVEETLASRASRGPVQVGQDELVMTHAIAGTDGSLVGVLLVSRNLAYLSRMQSTIAYSRKLVALGRLTAGIAHEVKNPLNAMMIHLELLRTKIRRGAPVGAGAGAAATVEGVPPDDHAMLQHVAVIEAEIRRLDEVVQGFLKFTRPEDLRLQPVRVRTLFEELLPIVEPEAQKSHVRVTVDCPPTLAVNGDAAMLRQACLNLAINACQAMPEGRTLRLTAAAAPLHQV